MIKPVTSFSYIAIDRAAKYISLCAAFLVLSGCLGGTVAQQIVRSIATSVADKAVANAMDVNTEAGPSPRQSIKLANRPPSDLSIALMHTSFREKSSNTQQAARPPIEKPIHIIKTNELVRVKVFNLIIGEEKNTIYEEARRIGTLNLPSKQEWGRWKVASGVIESSKTPITFLIPPELGKLPSGSHTIVELANVGNLNIARYPVNQQKVYQAMDETNASW